MLSADTKILRTAWSVGFGLAPDRHSLPGHDLDIGHAVLAGWRLALEGQGLLQEIELKPGRILDPNFFRSSPKKLVEFNRMSR